MAAFLSAFTGVEPRSPAEHDSPMPSLGGHLDVMTPDDAGELYGSVEAELDQPSFVGFAVRVHDLARAGAASRPGDIPYHQIGEPAHRAGERRFRRRDRLRSNVVSG